MKAILLIVGYSVLLSWSMPHSKQKRGNKPAPPSPTVPAKDTISFHAQLKPLLIKNCSPCHFPGGKMYARMPFDQALTITSHETGVLRRFNNEGEKKIVERFLNEHRAAEMN